MPSARLNTLFIDKQIKFGRYVLMCAGMVHASFIFLFASLNVTLLAFVNILSVFLYGYCIFLLNSKLSERKVIKIGMVVYAELMGHAFIASYLVGSASGFHYYLIPLAVLPFLTHYDLILVRSLKVASIVPAFLIFDLVFADHNTRYVIPENIAFILRYFNITAALAGATFVSFYYARVDYNFRKELIHSSSTDQLTGLFNRRHFTYLANLQVTSNLRDNNPLSLIILDIDYFKKINDTHGHLCGDQALKFLANMLFRISRAGDIVGRWGGEEFILMLPKTDIIKALSVAERIRVSIEKQAFLSDVTSFSMTVTLGVATTNPDLSALERLVEMADRALYKGKRNGRNQSVVYNYSDESQDVGSIAI